MPAATACAAHLRLRILLVRTAPAVPGHRRLLQTHVQPPTSPAPCNDPRALAEAMSRGLARTSAQLQQTGVRRDCQGPRTGASARPAILTLPDPLLVRAAYVSEA